MELALQAAVIGLIQGLTEFIPISSSAHLALAPWLFGWEDSPLVGSLEFDVFLHLGTLVALLAYFGRDWWRLIKAGLASIRDRRIGDDPDRRLAWMLALATVPAAVIGFLGEDLIAEAFHSNTSSAHLAIAGFLVIGATVLWVADRIGRRNRDLAGVDLPRALTIGFSQAAALLPGISRSGATIATGLFLGLDRETAARFSFLLATPITLGAGLYGARHLLTGDLPSDQLVAMLVGLIVAAVSGWASIRFLLNWLRTRSLTVFSVERIILAAVVVVLVAIGH
jgi:undecaprenyl-diphosphatase